jgi:hypothetical protein
MRTASCSAVTEGKPVQKELRLAQFSVVHASRRFAPQQRLRQLLMPLSAMGTRPSGKQGTIEYAR